MSSNSTLGTEELVLIFGRSDVWTLRMQFLSPLGLGVGGYGCVPIDEGSTEVIYFIYTSTCILPPKNCSSMASAYLAQAILLNAARSSHDSSVVFGCSFGCIGVVLSQRLACLRTTSCAVCFATTKRPVKRPWNKVDSWLWCFDNLDTV